MDHPWQWLMAGWRDTVNTRWASLFYGAIFVVMGYFLTARITGQFHMALSMGTGFMLVGPFLAIGLYDLSRRLETGEPADLVASLFAWKGNTMAILLFGILLGLIMVLWVRLSAVLYAITISGTEITVEKTASQMFFSQDGFIFLLVFVAVGAIWATVVFSVSVVSIPMLLDRKIDFIMAVQTSLTAVKANLGPMVLWAGLIVVFTGVGLATFYLGLAIAMPLIGHASWHAYRDLVEPEKG
jgi:uncharacterized membrane protein